MPSSRARRACASAASSAVVNLPQLVVLPPRMICAWNSTPVRKTPLKPLALALLVISSRPSISASASA
eukprot:2502926-Prymnesium_polylepis.3